MIDIQLLRKDPAAVARRLDTRAPGTFDSEQFQRFETARKDLQKAVEQDPKYSAAWKLLGRALNETGEAKAALEAYRKGIEIAQAKGDIQAAKEMKVFARRIEKSLGL